MAIVPLREPARIDPRQAVAPAEAKPCAPVRSTRLLVCHLPTHYMSNVWTDPRAYLGRSRRPCRSISAAGLRRPAFGAFARPFWHR